MSFYQPPAKKLSTIDILYHIDYYGEISVQQKGIYEPYFLVVVNDQTEIIEKKDFKMIDQLKEKDPKFTCQIWSGCEFTIFNISSCDDENKYEYVIKKRNYNNDKIYSRKEIIKFIETLDDKYVFVDNQLESDHKEFTTAEELLNSREISFLI